MSTAERHAALQDILQSIPAQPQRQDSLLAQMRDLRAVANRCGMYDAADYLRNVIETTEARMPRS